MPEANPMPVPSNLVGQYPGHTPRVTQKPNPLDYSYTNVQILKIPFGKLLFKFLKLMVKSYLFSIVAAALHCEALRSRHNSPRPEFRHGLFHLTHFDFFGPETPSPLALHSCSQQGRPRGAQGGGWAMKWKEDVMPIHLRRHDKKQQGAQASDVEGIIAGVFAISTACYTDRKPMFRV